MQGKYYSLLTNEESKTQKGRAMCIITKLVSLQTKDLEIHHWITVQEISQK